MKLGVLMMTLLMSGCSAAPPTPTPAQPIQRQQRQQPAVGAIDPRKGSPPQPSVPPLNEEASRQVTNYWDSRLTKCGDSYVVRPTEATSRPPFRFTEIL